MELIAYQNGELGLHLDNSPETRYTRVNANQLILCARMNDWGRFTAMWKRKTDPATWARIESNVNQLDSQQQWKLKEAFARLAAVDDETSAEKDAVASRSTLPSPSAPSV
ncbi:MAG TPA: hypothetical protein VI895_01715 [Bdellovibrionota bacterium]|nr:hypothetical protein [Bdellovibrionota bacterium]